MKTTTSLSLQEIHHHDKLIDETSGNVKVGYTLRKKSRKVVRLITVRELKSTYMHATVRRRKINAPSLEVHVGTIRQGFAYINMNHTIELFLGHTTN